VQPVPLMIMGMWIRNAPHIGSRVTGTFPMISWQVPLAIMA